MKSFTASADVCHIDDGAIDALTEFYRKILPPGGVLLDLMSSWVSHLPPEIEYAEVIGHGMNAEELAANPRLSRWFVQNFNREPMLSLADGAIDAAMMCVSIQYLERPVELLREVARALRPSGAVVVSFRTAAFGPRRWRSGALLMTTATSGWSSNTFATPASPISKPTVSPNGSRMSVTR